MSVIVRFLLRNIYEKKFRTFLIVFSITMSGALFFASSAISGTMEKMYRDRLGQYYGSAEVIVQPGEKSPSSFFTINTGEAYNKYTAYVIGAVRAGGSYKIRQGESVNVSLQGFSYEDAQTMFSFNLKEQHDLYPFTGHKMVIGQPAAEKYNLKLGDAIDIDIGGTKYKFFISAIAYPEGLFVDDNMSLCALVPRDTLSSIFDSRGKINAIFMKLKDNKEMPQALKAVSGDYKRYNTREIFSKQDLASQMGPMTTSFMLMTVIVFFISMFIIYSSFKVVTMERLPVIGTFRSIGATRKMTDVVLLAESFIYGIIGGVLGCGLGIVILYAMSYMSRPVWQTGFQATMSFTLVQLLAAFLVALLLSVISSILPIIKVSKIPVKDIVLNNIERKKNKKVYKLYLGTSLIAVALVLPGLSPRPIAFAVDVVCMIASIAAVVMLIPFITNTFVKLFERVYVILFGNVGVLAAKNLKDNRNIIGNISLLCIGISALLMINTISHSVGVEVLNVYNDLDYDIWMEYPGADISFQNRLKTIDGVQSSYGIYGTYRIPVVGKNDSIMEIHGIDPNQYPDYWKLEYQGDQRELLEELGKSRNILLSNILREKFEIEKGDIITLKVKKGDIDYKVTGFFNSLMQNGNYAIMSEKYLKADMGQKYYYYVFIKTDGNPDDVEKSIKDKFRRTNFWISTMNKMEENNMKSNNQMFAILNGFSAMTLLIGIFGVLNNYIISFIERKRSLAVLRSIGMNKKQILKMIFIESLTGGFVGGVFGILTGLLLLYNVTYVLKAMNLPITLHYVGIHFGMSLLGGIIISLIASIGPSFKSSKLNIIESIKYE